LNPVPTYPSTDSTANQGKDTAERYAPGRHRSGIALCLSGGGFRATLFHLGALRRLNEIGLLAKIDTITSVSGGSIAAAFLATGLAWPLTGPVSDQEWERRIASRLRAFAGKNLRTPALLRALLPPWQTDQAVRAMMAAYGGALAEAPLTALPAHPRFIFCATDLYGGVNFVFERDRIGDYRLGYRAPPADWAIGRAVAASACFPPFFNPLRLDLEISGFKGGRGPLPVGTDVRLSDGGLYDNLGLEPVWKNHETILVSDGGAVFGSLGDAGLLARLTRYVDVIDYQGVAVRKRWLISNFVSHTMYGAYWGIGSTTSNYPRGGAGYPQDLVKSTIAPVRTDLDAFSSEEADVLENHGYTLADAAVATHLPRLAPPPVPPPRIPNPPLFDAGAANGALRDSARRAIFGRW
jgi:NTE family protein